MKKTAALLCLLLALAFTLSCTGTIKKAKSSLVTVKISSNTAMLDIRPATPFERAKNFLARTFSPASAYAAIPSIVQDLRLTVSAADMATITATVNVVGLSSADFIVEVPNGSQRHFVVDGLDSGAAVQYRGDTFSDLNGDPVLLTINMTILPDSIPPTFAGLETANVLSSTSVLLSWSPATDNVTSQTNVVYLIYQATSPSGEVYTSPTYTTAAGATSFTVAGLTPGTTYYFVARAMDEAGNIDSNTIERTNSTPDTIPPTFAGLVSATTLTATSIQLTWSAATDNVTPQASIKYLVYEANAAGAEVFTTPTYSTTPGATGYVVNGLSQGIPYYFVVRAQDGAGNIDSNGVEKSNTLPDTNPPLFAGLSAISNVTGTSAQLSWAAAIDNVTPQANIVYLIFQATSPSGEIYATPSYTTAPGATNFIVTGLTPVTTYYFVVRAKDGAGNIDGNTIENTTSTPDTIPPVFAGLSLVSNITLSTMDLSWAPATDNVTPQGSIKYLIYQATSPAGEVYTAPTYSTTPGATSYTVTGLTTGTTYYFVVRAQDGAGNIDSNTMESPPSAYPSLFVNAVTGNDNLGSGTQAAPYATITKALSVTAGNEAILVSAGTYSATETFPLQLKAGTSLICQGPSHTTVIDAGSAGTGLDAVDGATGASIDGCRVFPGSDATAISDLGVPMTINNVVIDANGPLYTAWDAVMLLGDSTVMNSTFLETGSSHIRIDSGNPLIKNNTLFGTANSPDGIVITAVGNPTIQGNTFTGSLNTGGSAISLSTTGTVTIDSNTISWGLTSGLTGINIFSGSSVITRNTITSTDTGISISAGNPMIANNSITNGATGISVLGTGIISIASNTINSNSAAGVSIGAGTPTISGNTFEFNSNGITVTGATGVNPTITSNTIDNNTGYGISVSGGTGLGATINNNNLYCNVIADLFTSTVTAIDATSNAWDHDLSTTPSGPNGPTQQVPTCPFGIDICYQGPLPNIIPVLTAVSSPPACR